MSKNLVIVESPAKGKTIEKYLGKDFVVKSCFGHIRDLPKKGLNIDIQNNFEPTYKVAEDKKRTVAELKRAAKTAQSVWLASDEDREGEAIAWHLSEVLDLDKSKTKRIVFHEITKPAIEAAVANPRTVNKQLVDAQQARRILDRLVGYELSPVLWRKVRPGLSAGRVQSVAVRLVMEREREIEAFDPEVSYKTEAEFSTTDKSTVFAALNRNLSNEREAREFLESCASSKFNVTDVQTKPGTKNPSPPFTTSTLQQEAARRLGFSVKQTMSLAQRLYESGHITYMRTDSMNLSDLAIKSAKNFITKNYGAEYHESRSYQTKAAGAQEAHEAIRPTDLTKKSLGNDDLQRKLYELIWKRTLACQMSPARIGKTEITIDIIGRTEKFIAKGEILEFDGFIKVYGGGREDVILPKAQPGQELTLKQMVSRQSFSRPPARYSEASLVRKLEELGIGRPSTYAPTISTIQARGYVEKTDLEGKQRDSKTLKLINGKVREETSKETTGADRSKLLPTHLAEITTDFLVKHFASIVDYDFTARVEHDFDAIAAGSQEWHAMISEFYEDFKPMVKKSDSVSREETTKTRELGNDPKTNQPIFARFGRYGPMLQRGATDSEEKPDFAPLPQGVDMDDVTLEQALEMFKLPRSVGTTEDGLEIKANIGRFGPYIQVGKTFVSIKPNDPMKITESEAREFYAKKMEQEAEKHIQVFPSGIQVLKGPYGPYVTDGKKNARIAKAYDPAKLSEEDAKEILEKAPAKRKRSFRRKS